MDLDSRVDIRGEFPDCIVERLNASLMHLFPLATNVLVFGEQDLFSVVAESGSGMAVRQEKAQ